ncbi:MAG: DUF3137 domain-containing protein [Ferruginibacter sp.]
MEEISSFDEFYDIKLKPYLGALKKQSRAAGYWGIAMVVHVILVIPALVYGLAEASGARGNWIIAMTIALAIISIYKYTSLNDNYESNFKDQVIRQVIHFIHPGLLYKPDNYIPVSTYKKSSLYRSYYEYYEGNDLIEGTYRNVPFQCSALSVSKSRGRQSYLTVFTGLFFAAPVRVSGCTYVWLKGHEQLPTSIADERYRLLPMPNVVKMDCRNGEFEKYYAVYTNDVAEAENLLTAELMHAITGFMLKIKRGITLSFVSGMCYVAIPFEENLLEPQGEDPGDKNEIRNYFFTVLLVLGIINKFQLDRLQ